MSNQHIKYVKNNTPKNNLYDNYFSKEEAGKIRSYHKGFPEYKETPLVSLKELAKAHGIRGIYIKDESKRFGQNAFKVLGGSYAIANVIAKRLSMDISELTYEKLVSEEIRGKLGELTFVTATDGNHGRGVAWTANRLGQKCVVYMPKGTVKERLDNIRALGADADIMEFNYDDCVRLAAKNAEQYGWILVQDTSFEGYEEVPMWIMQGYLTMMEEAVQQLGEVRPTHVFLQAGVGAMAGSMTGYLVSYYGDKKPTIVIVEPHNANCFYETAKADDGELHAVTGDLKTIMAGLACGEPCSIAWDVMKSYAEYFISMSDYVAANGMRILGNPLPGDERVISGESGASGFGLAMELLRNPEFAGLKEEMGIDENAVILCISTEGDTDKENYREIVWSGKYTK